jgi:serine/threonine protein kinase
MAREEPAGGDNFIGRSVGNYLVDKKLGEGGMGAVYLLRHAQLPDTFAALKVLHGEGTSSQKMQERFKQEAMAAAAVGSHRVVRPLDIGAFEDGVPYILMEYVAGRSLEQELKVNGAMPTLMAVKIAMRVADTMSIAHQKGIIHRDLKPPNIMLPRDGEKDATVKLLDFGVARATGSLKVAYTNERAVIGTPGYMSPEAVAAVGVDGRTDVFSLGVILFQMLTNELPFPAPDVQRAMINVLTEIAPPVRARRPPGLDPIPPSVEQLVAHALTKDPQQRSTMAVMHQALTAAHDHLVASGAPSAAVMRSIEMRAPETLHNTPTLSKGAGEVAALIGRLTPRTPVPPELPAGPSMAVDLEDRTRVTPSPHTPAPVSSITEPEAAALRGRLVKIVAALVVLIVGGLVALWALNRTPTTASLTPPPPEPAAPKVEPKVEAKIDPKVETPPAPTPTSTAPTAKAAATTLPAKSKPGQKSELIPPDGDEIEEVGLKSPAAFDGGKPHRPHEAKHAPVEKKAAAPAPAPKSNKLPSGIKEME